MKRFLLSSISALMAAAMAVLPATAATTLDGIIVSVDTGIMLLSDNAYTGIAQLDFGGTSASYPALKRSAAVLQVKLADDSAYAALKTSVLQVDATITPAATTGTQTINKAAGTINVPINVSTIYITNSLVTTNSLVFVMQRAADTTGRITSAVPTTGLITIATVTNTATASVGFFVVNP